MAEGPDWFASAFRLIERLVGLRRPPEPEGSSDRAPPDSEPKVPAVAPPNPFLRCEPSTETQALPQKDVAAIKVELPSGQQDDESRRKLIRQFFNDYWAGITDKPATFAERLEIAERYINERLAEHNVGWRLDTVTREQLGLPVPKSSVHSTLLS
jgi:hypothetical protein